ncbi:MAG: hypothetical protein O6766_09600, partial [Gammaproteobacteria bacterium]|nr:hypothetical protein [Gammaproteobacteria bacterium]
GLPDVFFDTAGRSINGVRGYLQYLRATLSRNDVRYAVVAFDESLNTSWRNDVYPQYKANRMFPDYQALAGDSVDNVPGVKGVGDKTARRLVTTFGTLENIYDHRSRWLEAGIKESSKVAVNLHRERDRAFLFRCILRLATNAELRYPRDMTRVGRPKESKIRTQLKRLGLLESLSNVLIDGGSM